MDDDNKIRERVRQVLTEMDCSIKDLADKMGINNSNLSRKLHGFIPFTERDYRKLGKNCHVNIKWLTTGDGDMFVKKEEMIPEKPDGVPFYEADFAGGFVEFDDNASYPTTYINMPGMMGATCWCRVSGNSMSPLINNGDLICLKLIEDWDVFLNYGDVYAIDTITNQRTVKRVGRGSTESRLKLIPDNKKVDEQEIEKSSIRKIFKVIGVAKLL